MNPSLVLPLGLGLVSVLQAGMNRKVAANAGLLGATLINNLVLLLATVALIFVIRSGAAASLPKLRVWYAIPGMLGLALVAGIPLAISRLGAVPVFTGLIASQIAASLAWDAAFEGGGVTWLRAGGALLAMAGAVLSAR